MARPELGSINNTMYKCKEPQTGFKRSMSGKGRSRRQVTHVMRLHGGSRVNVKLEPDLTTPGVTMVVGERNPNGNAIYLPFREDAICSVEMEPPGNGVDFFFTANMSGCRFLVDEIRGSKNIMVSHANKKGGGRGTWEERVPSWQDPEVQRNLVALHQEARRDHGIAKLTNRITFSKGDYLKCADPLVAIKKQRVRARKEKRNLGIRNREFVFEGWTVIFGYPHGSEWRFYYQTVGRSFYTRPDKKKDKLTAFVNLHWNYLLKLKKEGATVYDGVNRVVGHGRIQ